MTSDEIRELAKRLEDAANDQNICGVDAGRTGSCHMDWQMDEAAKALNAMADLVEALYEEQEVYEPADTPKNKAISTIEEL